MLKYLSVFLICISLFSSVMSYHYSWTETEPLPIGKAIKEPCSCSVNCYFATKPLLKYASQCHRKDIEICNLNLTIREQNQKLDERNEKEKLLYITIHEKVEEIADRDSKITNLISELQNAQTQIKDNSEFLDNLYKINEMQKTEYDNALAKLEQQLKESKNDLENAQTQLEENSYTIENFKKIKEMDKNESDNVLKNLQELLQENEDELQNAQKKLEDNSKTIESLNRMNEIQRAESASALENLEQQLKKSKEDLKNTQTQLENSSDKIQTLQTNNEIEKENSEAALKNLEKQLKKSGEELENAQRQLEENSKTTQNLTRMYETQKTELKSAEQSCLKKSDDCQQLGSSNQVHDITVPVPYSFKGVCKSNESGSSWIIIQRRVNGNVDFNRSWEEYKFGFGDPNSSFFIGLEKLHLLTRTQTYELYIELIDKNNETKYAQYDQFIVGSENEAFELKSVGQHSGTASDSLTHLAKMKFTTIDRDNDLWSNGNCAKLFNGGWWFQNCGSTCLNGNYNTDSEQSRHSNQHGYHQHHSHHSGQHVSGQYHIGYQYNGHHQPGHHHFKHHKHNGHHHFEHRYRGHHHSNEQEAHQSMIWDNQTLSFAQMMIRVKV